MGRPINFDNPSTCTRRLVARAGALPVRVHHERGSVLVLVVGVLALLAIVVLVYSSIGQADKRTAVSVRDKARLNDYSEQISFYIAQQIADGATTFRYDQPQWTNAPTNTTFSRPVRKGSTYPSTNIEMRSVVPDQPTSTDGNAPAGNEAIKVSQQGFSNFRFSPTGNIYNDWYVANNQLRTRMADPRQASDPYLASSRPTWLNVAGGTAGNWGRPEILTDFARLPRYQRDLSHISVLSPDGRFVNLATLRGNFNAESGVGIDSAGRPRTTFGLTLLGGRNPNQYTLTAADIDSNAAPNTPTVGQAQHLWNGAVADLNIPWHWSTNQHGVARPVGDSPSGAPDGSMFPLGDYRHLSNQWVDADGDGIYDSRVYELVDASFGITRLLGDTGNLRLFVGTKVVDLSGKANVNVGTDQSEPALANKPFGVMGLTPADFDLERLLTGEWGRNYFGVGPDFYSQPIGTNASLAGNYSDYGQTDTWIKVGKAAYASLMASRLEGQVLPKSYVWSDSDLGQYRFMDRPAKPGVPAGPQTFRSDGSATSFAIFPQNGPMDSKSRNLLYRFASRDNSGASLRNTAGAATDKYQLTFSAPFSNPDELELRKYGFVNDAGTTSRLEVALDGRHENFTDFGPARSNRGIDAERDRRDGAPTPAPFDNQELQFRAQLVAARMAVSDVRQSLTTYNGSRPIRGGDMALNNPRAALTGSLGFNSLATADLQLDADDVLVRGVFFEPEAAGAPGDALAQRNRKDGVKLLFSGVANALLPYSNVDKAWEFSETTPTDAAHRRRRALYYGGLRGDIGNISNPTPTSLEFAGNAADLAIRASAHWTANLIADRDTLPVRGYRGEVYAFTLLLKDDNTTRTALNNGTLLVSAASGGRTVANTHVFQYWNIDGDPRGIAASIPDARLSQRGAAREASGLRFGGRLDLGRTTGDDNTPSNATTGALATKRLDDGTNGRRPTTGGNWQGQDAPAANVYAMGPQPFLTNVASLIMYHDADRAAGGDGEGDEWTRDLNDPTLWIPQQPTVTLTASRSNPDFMFELIAFELTNPYDVPINLTPDAAGTASLGQKDFYYYIEFGGQFYKIAAFDYDARSTEVNGATPGAGKVRPIVLKAKDSAVFFALTERTSVIEARMRAADPSVLPNAGIMRDLLRTQLTPTGTRFSGAATVAESPYRVMPFNPETGEVIDDSTVNLWVGPVWPQDGNASSNGPVSNLRDWPDMGTPQKRSRMFNGQARLWRMVVAPNSTAPTAATGSDSAAVNPGEGITGTTLRNDIANDVLVDRMRDPALATAAPTVDRRQNIGPTRVFGALGGLNPSELGQGLQREAVNDNAGFTIMFGASFRRPSASGAGTGFGQLPSYCVEAKSTLQQGEVPNADLYARARITGRTTTSYNIQEAFVFNGLRYAMANAGPGALGDDYVAGGTINGGSAGNPGSAPSLMANSRAGRHAIRSFEFPAYQRLDVMPNNQSNVEFKKLAPSITLLSAWETPIRTSMRPGDLLTPMAVGTYQNPYAFRLDAPTTTDPRNLDVQWLTQSEALALALDYDRPLDPRNTEFDWGRSDIAPTANTLARPVAAFDRGHLRLDAFVPFDDLGNGSGAAPNVAQADGIFQPTTSSGEPLDRPLGRGIPAALNLLDIFRTNSNGTLSTPEQGKININTATPDVLAAMGLLAPWNRREWVAGSSSTFKDFDKGAFRNTDDPFDLASSIVAYRDKQFMWSRPIGSNVASNVTLNMTSTRTPLPFHDGWTPAARLGAAATATSGAPVQNPYLANSRREITGIAGLREQRGFGSLGELLAVRFGAHHGTTGYNSTLPTQAIVSKDQSVDASIDRMGRRFETGVSGPTKQPLDLTYPNTNSALGWSSIAFPPATGQPAKPDLASDSFEQKLAIANSVLPSVAVRSDVFCVYFVIHGYTPSDVEGLRAGTGPADASDPAVTAPMEPSVKKRYVMVVDRSNVTAQGQKPRVLMLEEVPYK